MANWNSPRQNRRKGAIVVLAALLIVAMVGMLAFAIDLGYVCTLRTEAQRAADAGALAGAAYLGDDPSLAVQVARQYASRNLVGQRALPSSELRVDTGNWDEVSQTFQPTVVSPSAIRVLGRQVNQPFFFGKVFGEQQFDVAAEAIATYQPRDIIIVLDYSASMNDDSELVHLPRLGRPAIENNLLEIYGELGSPIFGNMGWRPRALFGTNASILTQLGLNAVPYPFPIGSWNEYIQYVKTDGDIAAAGYRDRYGYLTLVNYWLDRRPMSSESPDLWKTSEQPITAVKDAVAVFLAFIAEAKMDDRVGLAVYTYSDGTATLESGLTDDFPLVESISRRRQAGHYDHFTNIGAGMQKARIELEQNGRSGALKMIVLMTDGIANRPNGTAAARAFVLQEANRSAAKRFPIVTISLGAAADTALMQQVADITGGVHFNIPGGGGVADYEEELKEVFRKIAGHMPLRLVK